MMNKINFEKINHQVNRYKKLTEEEREHENEIDYHVDLGLLALEGLEIQNGLYQDLSVRLVLTRASGRFYLEIEKAMEGQENDPHFNDETVIKEKDFGKVKVEIVDT